ncbi:MAG: fasciclin domain-containing protein [Bacteroidota bacterium]
MKHIIYELSSRLKAYLVIVLMAALMFSLSSCGDDDDGPVPAPVVDPGLVEAATSAGLTTLLDAVTAADLAGTLTSAEAITVFAPDNDAFGDLLTAFGVSSLDQLVAELGGTDNLAQVLQFHVVPAVAFAGDLAEGDQTFTTLSGEQITVNRSGSTVTVSDVSGNTWTVTTADVAIDNGVVHVIDGVLIPTIELPDVVAAATAAGLTTLLDAVTAADLGATLTGADAITVFAPTNEAFGNLLTQYGAADLDGLIAKLGAETVSAVLQYHVVPSVAFSHDLAANEDLTTLQGSTLNVQSTSEGVILTDADGMMYQVSTADVAIANGVVHVIDGVVLPIDRPTIVEAATDAGLTTLLDAVTVADLGTTLLGAEAITVFAPTNTAFGNALDAFGVDNLDDLVTEIGGLDNLVSVLGFHVVPAVAYASDLAEGDQMFTTLNGDDITVNKTGAAVTVTDAGGNTFNVATADVTIENGVVHVIDGVLLPDLNLPTVVEAATDAGLTTLLAAVEATGLGSALLEAQAITVFAPTNDAFQDLLDAEQVDDLDGLVAKLGAEAVTDVLEFHVVPAVAFSHDLTDGATFTTLDGEMLTVNVDGDGNVTVTDTADNTYDVGPADVAIENGVVHVIDGVLLPTL